VPSVASAFKKHREQQEALSAPCDIINGRAYNHARGHALNMVVNKATPKQFVADNVRNGSKADTETTCSRWRALT